MSTILFAAPWDPPEMPPTVAPIGAGAGAPTVPTTAGEFKTYEQGNLKISVDTEWADKGGPGYVPVRLDITNYGEVRKLEIIGRGNGYSSTSGSYSGEINTLVRQTIHLNRGDRAKFTIPYPISSDSEWASFELRENGKLITPLASLRFECTTSAADFRVMKAGGSTAMAPPFFDISVERLPTAWQAYLPLGAVHIRKSDWEGASSAQKEVLLSWVACGGQLFVRDMQPSEILSGGVSFMREQQGTRQFFFGKIVKGEEHVATVMFGGSANALNQRLLQLRSMNLDTQGGFVLPLRDVGRPPVGAYFGILLLFTLLIGPANYFLLWCKKQQIWLVITVPMISAIFIFLLLGYSVLGEGFGVRCRAESFTILDQASKRAASHATVSLYAAGMAPAGGLRFPKDVAVIPILDQKRGRRDLVVDWTNEQQLASGFIQARTPCNFHQVQFRPARERLSFSREGDKIFVVNGLGGTIKKLLYRCGEHFYALDGKLLEGAKAELQQVQKPSDVFDRSRDNAPVFPEHFSVGLVNGPPDNAYIAWLEKSPFWTPGVPSVQETDSYHLVLGYLEAKP